MKHRLAAATALSVVAGGLIASPASAATTRTVCPTGCDYTTIAAAMTAASAGDTIDVIGDLVVAGQTTVNKDVTVTSSNGSSVTQTATAITFLMSGAGSTLSNLEITSDTAKPREFVQIGANDVTLSGNTIYGPAQAGPMGGWVTNRGFVTQGSKSGLLIDGNTFHSMRSGAYLNPNGSGTISNNTFYNTKGDLLIDNANFAITGNQAGDGPASEWGLVVFPGTAADRYTDLAALSQANNCMSAWDQRDGETYVDSDCDGVVDSEDDFPNDPDETTDTDGDGTGDNADNCVTVPNPQQNDNDGDLQGDACDADDDNDGVADEDDAFPLDPTESADADGDGVGDNADTDDDNDGLPDSLDNNSKEDCKNGGWQYFTSPKTFKNQGECVAYFASQKS